MVNPYVVNSFQISIFAISETTGQRSNMTMTQL